MPGRPALSPAANAFRLERLRASSTSRAIERFWQQVEKTEGCWLWRGPVNNHGYGQSRVLGENLAHRVAFRLTKGDIPESLTLDHLCRVTTCVNPAHLEPVTHRENVLRGVSVSAIHARQTTCPRGHQYDSRKRSGGRFCSICTRAQRRARYVATAS